jgi:hypothetical protein
MLSSINGRDVRNMPLGTVSAMLAADEPLHLSVMRDSVIRGQFVARTLDINVF